MQQKSLIWRIHPLPSYATVVASTLVGSARIGGGAMKRMIILSTLAAVIALMLALAALASAAEPETQTFHQEGTDVVANCGGFKVLTDFEEDVRVTTFFDSAGNPDYARVQEHFQDFFYNSKTGEGFAETDTLTAEFDLSRKGEISEREITSIIGLAYHVTVPGEGVVLLDAGNLLYDAKGHLVFEAGHHQILGSDADTEKLCEALA
jgi:hypothetical protein